MWESTVARSFRDSRLISIGGGADEVMLSIICKMMKILPKRKNKLRTEEQHEHKSTRKKRYINRHFL